MALLPHGGGRAQSWVPACCVLHCRCLSPEVAGAGGFMSSCRVPSPAPHPSLLCSFLSAGWMLMVICSAAKGETPQHRQWCLWEPGGTGRGERTYTDIPSSTGLFPEPANPQQQHSSACFPRVKANSLMASPSHCPHREPPGIPNAHGSSPGRDRAVSHCSSTAQPGPGGCIGSST